MGRSQQRDKPRRVRPRLARGMQDLLPADAAARQGIVDVVRGVYELHGFVPLSTPAIEPWEVLVGSGGEAVNKEIFQLEPPENEALGLRFDLTVPLARVVAQYQQHLPRPFRRYQVSPVWRLDKPAPGRFREFVQFDADIVGTTNALADAQAVHALRDVFSALLPGPEQRFVIRMSDRRILDALLARAGIPAEQAHEVFRVLDKLDRLGADKVLRELTTGYTDESGAEIPGLGFDSDTVAPVMTFLEIEARERAPVLADLRSFFGDAESAADALARADEFCSLLTTLGVAENEAILDVSIARGLAYYTGPVFEVALVGAESFGSVASGGRYDNLVGRFSGQAWPGTGVSVGVDRLGAVLATLADGKPAVRPACEVLVTVLEADRIADYAAACAELRRAGVRTELFAGAAGSIGKQVRHADRCGIPVVIIAGGDELSRDCMQLKRMETPEGAGMSREEWLKSRAGQSEVPRAELVSSVLEALGRSEGDGAS